MGTTRTIAAASLTALLVLGGCGGDDESPSSSGTTAAGSATTVAATTTTRSTEAIKAALLKASDVPGSTESPSAEGDSDLSACFPGNPLGAKTDPNEVDGPDLDIEQGPVRRNYTSSARLATPEQAKAFVATFASPTGSTCVLNAFKTDMAAPPDPVDASGITGKPSKVAVGDGGALLPLTGTISAQGTPVRLALDLLIFSKGPVVVFMSVGAFGAPLVAGQTLELAKKVAGRLP